MTEATLARRRCYFSMSQSTLAKHTVLVVEDEALIRMFAVCIFEDEGFEVLEAANAAEALTVLERRSDVEVLFTDVDMPGDCDGFNLALKSRITHPNIAVVIASGRPVEKTPEFTSRALFMGKPYTPEKVIAEVRAMIC